MQTWQKYGADWEAKLLNWASVRLEQLKCSKFLQILHDIEFSKGVHTLVQTLQL